MQHFRFGVHRVFGDFVAYKTGRFGIWGEFLVDVGFDDVRLLDHGIAGIEFLYMNGRDQLWMQSAITNSLFVGKTQGPPASAFTGLMCEGLQDVNGAVDHANSLARVHEVFEQLDHDASRVALCCLTSRLRRASRVASLVLGVVARRVSAFCFLLSVAPANLPM